ncbi:hypothetical protein ACOME3_006068 [Neoechinorhynchus agilis]
MTSDQSIERLIDSLKDCDALKEDKIGVQLSIGRSLTSDNQFFIHWFTSDPHSCLEEIGQRIKTSENDVASIKIIDIPYCDAFYRTKVPTSTDIGRFLCFKGTVVRVSPAKIYNRYLEFVCRYCRNVGRSFAEWTCSGGILSAIINNNKNVCAECARGRNGEGPNGKSGMWNCVVPL